MEEKTLKGQLADVIAQPVRDARANLGKFVRQYDQELSMLPMEQHSAILAQLQTSLELRKTTAEAAVQEWKFSQHQRMQAMQEQQAAAAKAEAAKPKLATVPN